MQQFISTLFKKGNELFQLQRYVCSKPSKEDFCENNQNKIENSFVGMGKQYGFPAERSCIDHMFKVKKLLKKCRKDIELMFIDLENPYDSVPKKMWTLLQMAGIDEDFI